MKQESEPSDIDSGPLSKTTSTCSSHSGSESSSASPVRLQTTSPALQSPSSVTSPLLAEQIVSDQQPDPLSPSHLDSQIDLENIPMASSDQGIPENLCPLSPSQHGSQMNPIVCESNSDSNTSSSIMVAKQAMPVQPCPLSPSQPGSRINPIECESNHHHVTVVKTGYLSGY